MKQKQIEQKPEQPDQVEQDLSVLGPGDPTPTPTPAPAPATEEDKQP
jgi:hypothetical protein